MRYGGILPGATTTAPAQHISSVAAVERFISEIGVALERRGTEQRALRRVRERIQAREVKQRRSSNSHAAGGLPRERDRAHQHCSR